MYEEPHFETLLAALPAQNTAELRHNWRQLTGRPAPKLGAMLLRHALAWELQAQVFGGLSTRTKRRLVQHANGTAHQQAGAGLTLVREWKGVLHTVTVDQDEVVHWDGKTWNSLSEVARAITGTRWSGPLFFGLKQRQSAAWRRCAAPSTRANRAKMASNRTSTRSTPSATPALPIF